MKKVLFTLAMLILLIGCGTKTSKSAKHEVKVVDGVKIHKNRNVASIDKFEINLKEKFVLDGSDSANTNANFTLFPGSPVLKDNAGNYYLIDKNESKVKKFDSKGNFVLAFGGKGNGPGEFQMAQSFVILSDSIYVTDAMTQSVVKFTTDGKFLGKISNTSGMPTNLENLSNGNLIGYIMKPQIADGKIKIQFNIAVFNSKLEVIKTIVKKDFDFNPAKPMNPTEMITFFATSKDGYFVAKKSETQFKIDNFDFDGKKKAEINKSYMKTPFSKKELEKMNAMMSKVTKGMGVDMKIEAKFKEAIGDLQVDKNGNLWVATAGKSTDDSKYIYDIFKDGVFLKTITLPLKKEETERFLFDDDDMITIDYENGKVKVYSY